MSDRKTILVLAANPIGTRPLQLDEEVKRIQEALQRSSQRENFVVEYRGAVTAGDVRRALLDLNPTIVHFAGDGSHRKSSLLLVNEVERELIKQRTDNSQKEKPHQRKVQYVTAEAMSELFALFKNCIECVVLNACNSEPVADAIAKHIPYAIGTNANIEERAARKFSEGFYDALGAGRSYEEAFAFGKASILAEISDPNAAIVPVLKKCSNPFTNNEVAKLRERLGQEYELEWSMETLARKEEQRQALIMRINEVEKRRNIADFTDKDKYEIRLSDLNLSLQTVDREIKELKKAILWSKT